MRRRDILALLGGATTYPIAASAQQPERMRRIGLIIGGSGAEDLDGRARVVAFLQGLQELGWTGGHNLQIDTRWGSGDAKLMRRYAAELVALAPDVILAGGTTTVGSLLEATRT